MVMIRLCLVMLFLISFLPSLSAETSTLLYQKAMRLARQGEIDLAFMNYHAIISDGVGSRYAGEALFACAEYQYMVINYAEAERLFRKYVDLTTDEKGKLFALIYLRRIGQLRNDDDEVREAEKEVIALKRHSYIFKDSHEYDFISPLQRVHKAKYNIDRIEFFIQGEPFAKISY